VHLETLHEDRFDKRSVGPAVSSRPGTNVRVDTNYSGVKRDEAWLKLNEERVRASLPTLQQLCWAAGNFYFLTSMQFNFKAIVKPGYNAFDTT
jgi:hypothetical protein